MNIPFPYPNPYSGVGGGARDVMLIVAGNGLEFKSCSICTDIAILETISCMKINEHWLVSNVVD